MWANSYVSRSCRGKTGRGYFCPPSWIGLNRSSRSEVFLEKVVLKICSKFTGEHPCQVAKQLYWNRTLACVFFCKSAAYFHNTFSKTKTFFKKLEYHFLVESINIENASFPHKTVIPKANVKTNRMMSTKSTCHKELSFASNYFIFRKFCFNLRTSYK